MHCLRKNSYPTEKFTFRQLFKEAIFLLNTYARARTHTRVAKLIGAGGGGGGEKKVLQPFFRRLYSVLFVRLASRADVGISMGGWHCGITDSRTNSN